MSDEIKIDVSEIVEDLLAGFPRCSCEVEAYGKFDEGKMAFRCVRCDKWVDAITVIKRAQP